MAVAFRSGAPMRASVPKVGLSRLGFKPERDAALAGPRVDDKPAAPARFARKEETTPSADRTAAQSGVASPSGTSQFLPGIEAIRDLV